MFRCPLPRGWFAFRRSFDQRGWADEYVRGLHEGFAGGWPFDPDAHRFLPADAATVDEEAVTFFVHARDFVEREWPDWAPASRRNSQRELARAVIDLVDDDAPVLTAPSGWRRTGICGAMAHAPPP